MYKRALYYGDDDDFKPEDESPGYVACVTCGIWTAREDAGQVCQNCQRNPDTYALPILLVTQVNVGDEVLWPRGPIPVF